jgi:hypothetical protein
MKEKHVRLAASGAKIGWQREMHRGRIKGEGRAAAPIAAPVGQAKESRAEVPEPARA